MVLLNCFIIISKVVPRAQRYVTGLMYVKYAVGPYLRIPNVFSAVLGVVNTHCTLNWGGCFENFAKSFSILDACAPNVSGKIGTSIVELRSWRCMLIVHAGVIQWRI